jgi:anti-sigma regulatory factor (Ser/Thr protein kinase)
MDHRTSTPRWLVSRVGAGIVVCGALSLGVGALCDWLPRACGWVAVLSLAALSVACLARLSKRNAKRPPPTSHIRTFASLAADVDSATSAAEVVELIEGAVRDVLRCEHVELSLEPGLLNEGFQSGARLITPKARGRGPQLSVELTFAGETLGQLCASRSASARPFTSEEEELCGAVARWGAVALAHATARAELDARREYHGAAWRDEREALIETLSAEIAHEVRYPINFFRSIFARAVQSRVLDDEDIEIGGEEVNRLERLVFDLRRMASRHLNRRTVDVGELCAKAQALLRDRMSTRRVQLDLDEGGALHCDPDKVTQVLVNLLANALEATAGRGEVGIVWRAEEEGGTLEVWDDGPGFGADPSRLFTAGHTTKPRGTGLGLAITNRLVRAHGWAIEAARHGAKTVFMVTIPNRDIAHASGNLRVAARVEDDAEPLDIPPKSKGKVA